MALSKKIQKRLDAIIKKMPKEEMDRVNKMLAEDEYLFIRCLITQREHNGGFFDLDGMEKHFRLARLMLEASIK